MPGPRTTRRRFRGRRRSRSQPTRRKRRRPRPVRRPPTALRRLWPRMRPVPAARQHPMTAKASLRQAGPLSFVMGRTFLRCERRRGRGGRGRPRRGRGRRAGARWNGPLSASHGSRAARGLGPPRGRWTPPRSRCRLRCTCRRRWEPELACRYRRGMGLPSRSSTWLWAVALGPALAVEHAEGYLHAVERALYPHALERLDGKRTRRRARRRRCRRCPWRR